MLHKAPPQFIGSTLETLTSGDQGLPKPEPLLRISALSVDYNAAGGNVVHAVRNLDLEIASGESLGVLGESGSGKSSLALALLRLLPKNARVVSGSIDYRGRNITELSPAELRAMRGAEVALISQEPALALNPVLSLGQQLVTFCGRTANLRDRKWARAARRCCGRLDLPILSAFFAPIRTN